MNMNIPINKRAPVVAKSRIIIHCAVNRVWEVLTTIDKWPEWQTGISEARMHGAIEQGTAFSWKAAGLSFESTIHTCRKNEAFGWTGKTTATYAVHNWIFQEKDGETTVTVEESLQGILPRLLRGSFRKSLRKGMQIQLEELKNTSEK